MSNQVQQFDPETGEIGNLPVGYTGQDSSLAVSLARAEVDQQVATARALPRQPARVMASILSLATLDEKTAEECVYALPRGGKPIKGPSVRLAEIIGSQWGNCRIGARVVHVDRIEKYVEAEGVFHDLETNAATTARVRRRIVDSKGRLYNDDMIVVTGNAACAIAKRNAILGAVPKAVWRKAYEAVESVIAGDAVTLVERRDKAMKAFAAFGVTPERVCAALAIAGPEEITLEHMPILMGAHSALKSGEATVEELFPVEKGSSGNGAKPKSLADRLDALAVQPKEKKQKSDSPVSSRAGSDGEGTRDAHSSGQGASDTRSPSGASTPNTQAPDGDAPSSREAYEAGQQARAKGVSRKAVPQRFSGDEHLLEQWLAGFDGDVDEREPGEEG